MAYDKLKLLIFTVFAQSLIGACSPPSPSAESNQLPSVITDARTVKEGSGLSFVLSDEKIDYAISEDRLDPGRLKRNEPIYSCFNYCPEGIEVNPDSGAVTFEPTYDQQGIYLVHFLVEVPSTRNISVVPIVVENVDRSPAVATESIEPFQTKEGERLAFAIEASDPDGNSITPRCINTCPLIDLVHAGRLEASWQPTFSEAGTHKLRIGLFSSTKDQLLKIEGPLDGYPDFQNLDLTILRKYVFSEESPLATYFDITIDVEETDQPPQFLELPKITGKESVELRFFLEASDPDKNDTISYSCLSDCPPGLSVDESSGLVRWTPDFLSAGESSVLFNALGSGGIVSTQLPVVFDIENTNRAPALVIDLPATPVKEASLSSFRLSVVDPDTDDSFSYTCESGCPETLLLDKASGRILWTPGYEESGLHQMVVSVSDGTDTSRGNISLAVEHQNRAPYFISTPQTKKMIAGFSYYYTPTFKDDDVEDAGKLVLFCASATGQQQACPKGARLDNDKKEFSWLPQFAHAGDHIFRLGLSDGLATALLELPVTVELVDVAPSIQNFTTIYGRELSPMFFYLSALDPEGMPLSYRCKANCPAGLTVDSESGFVFWLPADTDSGVYDITFAVSANAPWPGGSPAETSTTQVVSIANFNRPPTIGLAVGGSINEMGHNTLDPDSPTDLPVDFVLTATDPDGDDLSFYCFKNCPSDMVVSADTGHVLWRPAYNSITEGISKNFDNVIFAASDGEFISETLAVSYTLYDVNRPPQLTVDTEFTVYEQGHKNTDINSEKGHEINFVLSATDADGDRLVFGCETSCPTGLSVDSLSGRVYYKPDYSTASQSQAVIVFSGVRFFAEDHRVKILSEPVTITVVNVNRRPSLVTPNLLWEIFESGHTSKDETSATSMPLSFTLGADDPDGDALVFSCDQNCPVGLVLNSQTGQVSWRPSYVTTESNASAKPLNAPYANIVFSASDGGGKSYYPPIVVAVKNVDRKPVVTELNDLRTPENQPLDYQILAHDPDGDAVSFRCLSVQASERISSGLLAGPEICEFGYSPTAPVYGVSQWFRLDSSGQISIGSTQTPDWSERPGYFDSQKQNAPYIMNYILESSPDQYDSATLKTEVSHAIVIENVDRAPEMAVPGRKVIYESQGNLVFSLRGESDPDGEYGEFNDLLEFSCSDCPDTMEIDLYSGQVVWAPDYNDALEFNAVRQFEFILKSTPDGYDSGEYPPIIRTADVEIQVKNWDRLPVFTCHEQQEPQDGRCTVAEGTDLSLYDEQTRAKIYPLNYTYIQVHEPRYDAPNQPYSAVIPIEAYDPDSGVIDTDSGVIDTEIPVEVSLVGCYSSPDQTVADSCPSWISHDTENSRLIISPSDNDIAVAASVGEPQHELRLELQAYGSPREDTGWVCGDSPFVDVCGDGDDGDECILPENMCQPASLNTLEITVVVINQDRPPSFATNGGGDTVVGVPAFIYEDSEASAEVHVEDADTEDAVYALCINNPGADSYKLEFLPESQSEAKPSPAVLGLTIRPLSSVEYSITTRQQYSKVFTKTATLCSYHPGFSSSAPSMCGGAPAPLPTGVQPYSGSFLCAANTQDITATVRNVDRPAAVTVTPGSSTTFSETDSSGYSFSIDLSDEDGDIYNVSLSGFSGASAVILDECGAAVNTKGITSSSSGLELSPGTNIATTTISFSPTRCVATNSNSSVSFSVPFSVCHKYPPISPNLDPKAVGPTCPYSSSAISFTVTNVDYPPAIQFGASDWQASEQDGLTGTHQFTVIDQDRDAIDPDGLTLSAGNPSAISLPYPSFSVVSDSDNSSGRIYTFNTSIDFGAGLYHMITHPNSETSTSVRIWACYGQNFNCPTSVDIPLKIVDTDRPPVSLDANNLLIGLSCAGIDYEYIPTYAGQVPCLEPDYYDLRPADPITDSGEIAAILADPSGGYIGSDPDGDPIISILRWVEHRECGQRRYLYQLASKPYGNGSVAAISNMSCTSKSFPQSAN